MPEQTDLFFDSGDQCVSEKDRAYMTGKVHAVEEKLPEIDALLESCMEGWKLPRIGKVEKAILRLAVFEMKFDEDIPLGVAINEAVELAARFGQESAASFVNGVLARVAKSCGGE